MKLHPLTTPPFDLNTARGINTSKNKNNVFPTVETQRENLNYVRGKYESKSKLY